MVLTRSASKAAGEDLEDKLFEESDTDGDSGDNDVKVFYALAAVGVLVCFAFFSKAPPLPADA